MKILISLSCLGVFLLAALAYIICFSLKELNFSILFMALVFLYSAALSFSLIIKSVNCNCKFLNQNAERILKITKDLEKANPFFSGTLILLSAVMVIISVVIVIIGFFPTPLYSLILYISLSLTSGIFISKHFACWLTRKLNHSILSNDFHFSHKTASLVIYVLYFGFIITSTINFYYNLGKETSWINDIIEQSFITFLAWDMIVLNWHHITGEKPHNCQIAQNQNILD